MDEMIYLEQEPAESTVSNPSPDNSIVLYDPSVVNSSYTTETHEPYEPITRAHPFSDRTPRTLPCVGAFTVQCGNCFKWRLIPTKEKYEEIREHILEQPFVCETAREWRSEISCNDPPDLTQDDSMIWAIDIPSIAQPPLGWQRLLRIRGEGSYKFADVYYVAPSGKTLRSMVEIQRYLDKHPRSKEGIRMSQFSFKAPRPLQENYVRKRPATRSKEAPRHDPASSVDTMASVTGSSDSYLQLMSSNMEHSTDSAEDLCLTRPKKKGKSD